MFDPVHHFSTVFFHLLETVGSGGSKKYLRCGLFGNLMSVAVDPYKLAVGARPDDFDFVSFRFRFFSVGFGNSPGVGGSKG